MKTVLPLKHLLRTLSLCLFCCASLSVLAQGENDGDGGNDPGSPPPIRPINTTAAITQSSTTLTVIFLEEAEATQVEVCNADGLPVFVTAGTVTANSRLLLDSRSWKRGQYTVRVSARGKAESVSAVQLR